MVVLTADAAASGAAVRPENDGMSSRGVHGGHKTFVAFPDSHSFMPEKRWEMHNGMNNLNLMKFPFELIYCSLKLIICLLHNRVH